MGLVSVIFGNDLWFFDIKVILPLDKYFGFNLSLESLGFNLLC